jgi:hypothetical protein
MKPRDTSDKFDEIMKMLLDEASADDSYINDIADTPALWWNVRRNISKDPSPAMNGLPFFARVGRLLAFAVPAAAAVLVFASVFIYRPDGQLLDRAAALATTSRTVMNVDPGTDKLKQTNAVRSANVENNIVSPSRVKFKAASTTAVRPVKARFTKPRQQDEIKSDFIALSYTNEAQSGQYIRVKVPSSMMVSLGLVSTVEKPAMLVDAEVIVGDDGLTRAIRFIR